MDFQRAWCVQISVCFSNVSTSDGNSYSSGFEKHLSIQSIDCCPKFLYSRIMTLANSINGFLNVWNSPKTAKLDQNRRDVVGTKHITWNHHSLKPWEFFEASSTNPPTMKTLGHMDAQTSTPGSQNNGARGRSQENGCMTLVASHGKQIRNGSENDSS